MKTNPTVFATALMSYIKGDGSSYGSCSLHAATFTLRFVGPTCRLIDKGLLYNVATFHTLSTRQADTNVGRIVSTSLFFLVLKHRSIAPLSLPRNLAVSEKCKQEILAQLITRKEKKTSSIQWCLHIKRIDLGNKLTFSETEIKNFVTVLLFLQAALLWLSFFNCTK